MTSLVFGQNYNGIITDVLERETRRYVLGIAHDGRNLTVQAEDNGRTLKVEIRGTSDNHITGVDGRQRRLIGRHVHIEEGEGLVVKNPYHKDNFLEFSFRRKER